MARLATGRSDAMIARVPHPLWNQLARDASIDLSAEQLALLDRYLDSLIAWNEKLNLTRIVDRADAEVKHVADALTLLKHLPRPGELQIRLADVGTGGGVPGVPLAICRPDAKVTLIDATKKKLDAVTAICSELGIANVQPRHTRVEAVRDRFEGIVTRAVADVPTLLNWCGLMMSSRSVLLMLKGPRAREEIASIPASWRRAWQVHVHEPNLPELPGHVVVEARKAVQK
jgi:16S rRNA (guanine527-N7)-methyltransferase